MDLRCLPQLGGVLEKPSLLVAFVTKYWCRFLSTLKMVLNQNGHRGIGAGQKKIQKKMHSTTPSMCICAKVKTDNFFQKCIISA